jgi:hypothetical protein
MRNSGLNSIPNCHLPEICRLSTTPGAGKIRFAEKIASNNQRIRYSVENSYLILKKRTQNEPKTNPKRTQNEPKRTQIEPKRTEPSPTTR